MKEIPNATFATLLKDLPTVLNLCHPDRNDLKAVNAKRRLFVALRKLNKYGKPAT